MNKNLTMVRGDTFQMVVNVDDMPSSATAAYFTCRSSFGGTQLLQKTLGSGITQPTTGVFNIILGASDTSSLSYGTFVYDFKVQINSDVYTILKGDFIIEPDVKNLGGSGEDENIYGQLISDLWG